jgi:hypothetical protein
MKRKQCAIFIIKIEHKAFSKKTGFYIATIKQHITLTGEDG